MHQTKGQLTPETVAPVAPAVVPTSEPSEYRAWLDDQFTRERSVVRAEFEITSAAGAAPNPLISTEPGTGTRGSGGPGLGWVTPAPPLPTFWFYENWRPDDWNTCGQAAIASMLDFYSIDIGLPRSRGGHWVDGDAIDKVKALGFGPDVAGGFGTSPGRIAKALASCGVPAVAEHHSGLFFAGWGNEWNRLLAYVYYSAIPVPVLIDTGLLGGPAFGAHWPIAWKMEFTGNDMLIHLANWSSVYSTEVNPVPKDRFLQAWSARHLPLGFNHAGIYTGSPRIHF